MIPWRSASDDQSRINELHAGSNEDICGTPWWVVPVSGRLPSDTKLLAPLMRALSGNVILDSGQKRTG
jgi:hypothetical protein